MKQVLVTGGTGRLGKWVVDYLLQKNLGVSILSTKENLSLKNNITLFKGNLATNSGLSEATAEADMIIHCASNSKSFEQTDINGTRNLLNAISKEKTKHFVYISIVGVDKSGYPYYRAKYTVEKMIAGSGIPYTILRATQFHSFVLTMVQSLIKDQSGRVIKIPAGMKFQSVDIREVAKQLVDGLEKDAGLLPDFGGPEILPFEVMVQIYLTITKTKAVIQPASMEGVRYDLFRSGVNLCPHHAIGKITWQRFLEETITPSFLG